MGNPSSDTFILACPTVPVVRGLEVRFSIEETYRAMSLSHWPLAYIACGEITPPQPLRSQWGVPTAGARYDSFGGVRLGSDRTNLVLGSRSTYASNEGRIGLVERQRVGIATLTLGGRVSFKYWNDHAFWWWPIGGGTDQGDTAGLQFRYNLAPHNLSTHGWQFEHLSLSMRLATGIPNRDSAKPMGDGFVYSEVKFDEINRGDIDLSTSLSRKAQRLEVGILVNSDAVRHATQDRAVHHTLGIPEFPRTGRLEVMVYMRLTSW